MRHRGESPNAAALAAQAAAEEASTKKKGPKTLGDARFVRALEEATAMLKAGAWADAKPIHFVALYAELHFRVYGVEDVSLGPAERPRAILMAKNMLSKEFGDDRGAFARFVAWAWSHEKKTEAWRRANDKSGGKLTWYSQFSRPLLVRYRVDFARTNGKAS